MAMNVNPVPTLNPRTNEIRMKTAEIVNKDILPNEKELWSAWREDGTRDTDRYERTKELRREIQAKVKEAGLWAPHLPPEYGGCELGFLDHAYMNEVLAYSLGGASLFGVVAPNSGNQKNLLKYGSEEQKQKWLVPLTEGRMQSGFSMTEPDSGFEWSSLEESEIERPAATSTYVEALAELIDALEGRGTLRSDGAVGRRSLEMVMAIYQSQLQGNSPIRFPVSLGESGVEALRREGPVSEGDQHSDPQASGRP